MTRTSPRRLSLRQNFVWTLLGSLVENGAKWAMFIILTKKMSSEVVGAFSLALAIATPINILSQFQLRAALATDANDEHPFGAYYAMRILCTALSMVVIAIVGVSIYGVSGITALIVLVGAAQGVVSMRDIWLALAQKYERMDVNARSGAGDGVLSLILFGAVLLLTGDIYWATCGLIAAHLLVLVGYDVPRVRAIIGDAVATRPQWAFGELRRLLWVVLPLGITMAIISLNSNIPRYFIEGHLGTTPLAYFAAIAYFVFAAKLITSALGRAAVPRLAILYHSDRARYATTLLKLLAVAVAMAAIGIVGAMLVGELFLRVAYSAEYAEQSHILVMLMVAGGIQFVNAFLGTAVAAARFFKVNMVTYIAAGITALVSCVVLIPRHGLEGAAGAVIVTAVVNTLINAAVVVYVYRQPSPRAAGVA